MGVREASDRKRESLIQEARDRRTQGESYRTISEALGVPQATVYRWLNAHRAEADRKRSRETQRRIREAAATDPQLQAAIRVRKKRERERRARRVASALEMDRRRLERAALAAQLEGRSDKAYAFVRKALQQLETAPGGNSESRAALRRAQTALHDAEDALGAAARLEAIA